MSDIINKIAKSRKVLKELLENEYDTSTLDIYTIKQIDELYSKQIEKNDPYFSLGNAISCNFTLNHKKNNFSKIHIFYYNFPEYNSLKSTKFNKSVIQRIIDLYNTDIIGEYDNVIIIINEKITDSYETILNNLNESLQLHDFSSLKSNLDKRHFRISFLFNIDSLQCNLLNHELVPKHEVIRNSDDIKDILNKCNCELDELPIIKHTDAIARLILCVSGDICKITRKSTTNGYYEYYRLCH